MKRTLLPFIFLFLSISAFSQKEMPSATNATAGKLTVKFAAPAPGTQAYYAVYITNSANQLVNTLSYRYGNGNNGRYCSQLNLFWPLIGSVFNTANFKYVGTTDGVSGATLLNTAVPLTTVYWGQSTSMASAVAGLADGEYKVNFEMVKHNNNRSYTSAIFVKGPAPSNPTVSPTITTFNNISVDWKPLNTAVKSVELEKMYTISPNPVKSSFIVKGSDIVSVDLFSMAGKRIKSTNETKMNISSLAGGNYIAVVTTKNGNFSKKIIKQ